MATIFGGSRLANLREKKSLNEDTNYKKEEPLKLELFQDKNQKTTYEPSISLTNNNRTHTRLLKGRIERPSGESTQNNYPKMESRISDNPSQAYRPSLQLGQNEQLKLVINDEPKIQQKKSNNEINPLRTTQKRILIAKEPERESSLNKIVEKPKEQPLVVANPVVVDSQPEKPSLTNHQQKPIREQQVQESLQQNQNELIECPEGCGRKFHKKALEKHAKACKLVFMSKRKQFNSEAKRLVNKQQANIAKQVKAKQRRQGKSKGFQKTGDNWKSASEDFRAAIKAIKKQTAEEEKQEQNEKEGEQKQLKVIPCKYCGKQFAEVFVEKHLQSCLKKRQSQKKKPTIPKKK